LQGAGDAKNAKVFKSPFAIFAPLRWICLMFFAGSTLSLWLLKEPLGVQFFLGGGMIVVDVLVVSAPTNRREGV
jgi:hypothetical protein